MPSVVPYAKEIAAVYSDRLAETLAALANAGALNEAEAMVASDALDMLKTVGDTFRQAAPEKENRA